MECPVMIDEMYYNRAKPEVVITFEVVTENTPENYAGIVVEEEEEAIRLAYEICQKYRIDTMVKQIEFTPSELDIDDGEEDSYFISHLTYDDDDNCVREA